MKWKAALILFIFLFSSMSAIPLNHAQEAITPIANDAYYFEAIDVEVGDKSVSGFKPHILLRGWKGEAQLSLGFDDSQILVKSVKVENEIIKWETPTFDFYYYQLSSKKLLDYDGLEFEVILKQKPLTNSWSFPIKADGLVFYYQSPLNEESWPIGYTVNATHAFNEKGELVSYRPRNVVGSHAVYHESKRDNQYTTGKLWHIYTPHLIDSEGNEDWGTLNIVSNVFTIILPQNFLDTAKYPIFIDPTFGKTDIGGSWHNFGVPDRIVRCLYPLSEVGDVNKITAYLRFGDNLGFRGITYDTSGNLKIESSETLVPNTAQWNNFTVSPDVSLGVASYHLGIHQSGSFQFAYDSGDTDQGSRSTADEYDDGAEDPYVGNLETFDEALSIYATYTTGGVSYERNPTQSISWSSSLDRTWSLSRVMTQSLTWSSDLSRKWSLKRSFSLPLTFTYDAEGILSTIHEFVRTVTLAVNWASNLSRKVDFHRTISNSIKFTFNLPGLVAKTIRVWVKTLQGVAVEDSLVTLSNPSAGTILWAYYTDPQGYTPQEDLSSGEYSLWVTKDDYQTYNLLFNFSDTTIVEVPLRTVEEGIMFNMELLIFSVISILSTYVLLFNKNLTYAVPSGVISFFGWYTTGIYYMITNTDKVHFGLFFIMLGTICMILTVLGGLWFLNPYHRGGIMDEE